MGRPRVRVQAPLWTGCEGPARFHPPGSSDSLSRSSSGLGEAPRSPGGPGRLAAFPPTVHSHEEAPAASSVPLSDPGSLAGASVLGCARSATSAPPAPAQLRPGTPPCGLQAPACQREALARDPGRRAKRGHRASAQVRRAPRLPAGSPAQPPLAGRPRPPGLPCNLSFCPGLQAQVSGANFTRSLAAASTTFASCSHVAEPPRPTCSVLFQ